MIRHLEKKRINHHFELASIQRASNSSPSSVRQENGSYSQLRDESAFLYICKRSTASLSASIRSSPSGFRANAVGRRYESSNNDASPPSASSRVIEWSGSLIPSAVQRASRQPSKFSAVADNVPACSTTRSSHCGDHLLFSTRRKGFLEKSPTDLA